MTINAETNTSNINNTLLGVYKITKQKCLNHINGKSICQDISLYEFNNEVYDESEYKNNKVSFIQWRSDSINPLKVYFNGSIIQTPKKLRYPFTIVIGNNKTSYIETIQFLDKTFGIHRSGYKDGLIKEVYFERISQTELDKYYRNFPNLNKKNITPTYKKSHISRVYFERIMKNELKKKKQTFTYDFKDLENVNKLYGLKDIHSSKDIKVPL